MQAICSHWPLISVESELRSGINSNPETSRSSFLTHCRPNDFRLPLASLCLRTTRVIEASEFFISYFHWPTLKVFLQACLHIEMDANQFPFRHSLSWILVPYFDIFRGILMQPIPLWIPVLLMIICSSIMHKYRRIWPRENEPGSSQGTDNREEFSVLQCQFSSVHLLPSCDANISSVRPDFMHSHWITHWLLFYCGVEFHDLWCKTSLPLLFPCSNF